MMRFAFIVAFCVLPALAFAPLASAGVLITEVDAAGSGNSAYGGDWFELTNTGASDVNIGSWKMDDGSFDLGVAAGLRGVATIPAGRSAIFLEGNTTGSNDATIAANFISYWFGGTAPAGFLIGGYGGSGVSLSTSAGDGVIIFDSANLQVAKVSFGAIPAGNATLDNAAGLDNVTISKTSIIGINNAFAAATLTPLNEIGSPGVVPEPGTAMTLLAATVIGLRRRR